MFRTAAFLTMVLAHVAPGFQPRAEAAAELSRLGQQYQIDPLLVIADAEHESQWRPDVVNPISGTTGLMQIQPLNLQGCASTGDKWSLQCWTARQELYDWRLNLRVGTGYFAFARKYCVKHGYGGLAVFWLSLPTGFDAVRHSRCGHRNGHAMPVPERVLALLKRRHELERIALARPQSASKSRPAIVQACIIDVTTDPAEQGCACVEDQVRPCVKAGGTQGHQVCTVDTGHTASNSWGHPTIWSSCF